jgi:hypothetical protein
MPLVKFVESRDSMIEQIPQLEKLASELKDAKSLRPRDEWHEDDGPVLWWRLPIQEPPWTGMPIDEEWTTGSESGAYFGPDYYTHWTPIIIPDQETAKPIIVS